MHGRVGGEESEPRTVPGLLAAGARLARDGHQGVVRAAARAVVDRADHAGYQVLHALGRDVYVALDLALEANVLFGRARQVRDEQVAAVGDGRGEVRELDGRDLDVVAVRGHVVDGVALL